MHPGRSYRAAVLAALLNLGPTTVASAGTITYISEPGFTNTVADSINNSGTISGVHYNDFTAGPQSNSFFTLSGGSYNDVTVPDAVFVNSAYINDSGKWWDRTHTPATSRPR